MIQWQLTNNLFRRWINSKGSIPYIYRNTYVSTNESNVRFWNNCKRLSIACQFEIIAIAIFANISHGKNIFQQNIVSLFTLRRRIILRFPRSKSAVDVSILVVYSQKERDKRPVAVISVQPYQPSSKRACFLSNFDRVNNRSQLVISIDAWVESTLHPTIYLFTIQWLMIEQKFLLRIWGLILSTRRCKGWIEIKVSKILNEMRQFSNRMFIERN